MGVNWMRRFAAIAGMAMSLGAAGAWGQFISNAPQSQAADKAQAVEYLFPEQVMLPAGKASPVELHFRVAAGLHINSHAPSDDFLIPTSFSIPAGAGAKLADAVYPAGVDFTLPADPKMKLNVYTGAFTIRTRLIAQAGDHLVRGTLRYQACDQAQCMPPKTIPVALDVIGK
jgi:hypothetical protein